MANAKAQHELVGVLVNLYPRLAVRLAEVTGEACPPHERASAGPNTHQVRKAGKRRQVASDVTVYLLWDEKKCHFFQVEMQRDYKWSKLTTLRAITGAKCATPSAAVTYSCCRLNRLSRTASVR